MMRLFQWALLMFIAASYAIADEYRPAYLELVQTSNNDFDMLWKLPANNNGRLAIELQLPNDIVFITEPITAFSKGSYSEHAQIARTGGLVGAEITILGLERLPTDVLIRIERLNGSSETARLHAASSSYIVQGTPGVWNVVTTYLVFGIEHILEGFDHLLFIACLIFIARSWQRILITITGFTLAHSITLTLAGLKVWQAPIAPIEAVIALSIVFLAREIVLDRRDTLTWRYPIAVSASFGLLHGFGFASALADIGLPQTEIPAALLAFNLGVEVGQILFVGIIMALSQLTYHLLSAQNNTLNQYQYAVEKPIAYGIGSMAMFWTLERLAGLWA